MCTAHGPQSDMVDDLYSLSLSLHGHLALPFVYWAIYQYDSKEKAFDSILIYLHSHKL